MNYRQLICVTVFFCSLTVFSPTALAAGLPDIRGHWGESYIEALAEMGAISGMPDGKFYPDEVITLPQFIRTIISLNYGDLEPINDNWASGYMWGAMERGVITPDELEDNRELTRFNATRIINNSLKNIYFEPPIDLDEEQELAYIEMFEDIETGCVHCGYELPQGVAEVYAKGIISGRPGLIFDGNTHLTRAEACVLIMRMIEPGLRTPRRRPEAMLSSVETEAVRFGMEYPMVGDNNVFVYGSVEEIIDVLENGTGVVFLSFPSCPWCQAYAPFLNEVAVDLGIDKIIYYDLYEDRVNNSDEYQKIVSILNEHLELDTTGRPRVYVPDVTVVKNGEIIGHDNETSTISGDVTPDEYWTEDRIAALKNKLKSFIMEDKWVQTTDFRLQ